MTNLVYAPPCSRITLTVAMETMHFFIVQTSSSLRTKILCTSGVQMNDLAPMKNCPGGYKVGQISYLSNKESCTIYLKRPHMKDPLLKIRMEINIHM